MSAWRALIKEIAQHGPMRGTAAQSSELYRASLLGVIERCVDARWRLTPLGVDFLEGRVVQIEVRPGGRHFAATWLRSLPKNIRLGSHLDRTSVTIRPT